MNRASAIPCRLALIAATLASSPFTTATLALTGSDGDSSSEPGVLRSLSDVLVVDALGAEAGCANVDYDLAAAHAAPPLVSPRPGGEVRVDVFLFIVAIDEIDATIGTFRFEGYGGFIWCDPRMAFDASTAGTDRRILNGRQVDQALETMWWPGIFLPSQLGAPVRTHEFLTVFADGTIEFSAKLNTRLLADYDFTDFPLDHQTLSIPVQTYLQGLDRVDLRADRERIGLDETFDLPEWWVNDFETRVERLDPDKNGNATSRLVMDIHIARKAGFYFWKALLPIVIIVSISYSVFWMTYDVLAQRQRQSATGVLTLVAFQFVATDTLPRVPYLTAMDAIVLWSFVVSASTLVLNVVNNQRYRQDEALGLAYDRRCRWLYPAVYLVGLLLIGLRRYVW